MKICRRIFIIMIFTLLLFSNQAVEATTSNKRFFSNKNKYDVLIDLSEFKLYLINKSSHEVTKTYPIASGKPGTPSPIGTWKVVQKSANWGTGFGTRWIQLNCPWGIYGIHGTNKPSSINNAQSHGCIRMHNKDVEELYRYIDYDTVVVIYAGPTDLISNIFRTLKPGDRGSDVFEIQRKLKDRGYYSGSLNGIYGEELKSAVIKFRKDNQLELTHYVDKDFYNKLEIIPFE